MKIIRGIKNLHMNKPTAVTIGMFDGIHRGHKRILKLVKMKAMAIKGKSCVLTFGSHPAKVLYPEKKPPMLISNERKLSLLAAEGIDIAVLINFTKHFAGIRPERFINEILVKRLNIKELVVGEGFLFGNNKAGNLGLMRKLGQKYSFRVHSIAPLKAGKDVISSTLIRKLVMSGKLNEAKKLMGRDAAIIGAVARGTGRGRLIGMPTANLNLHHEAIPPDGVYIVKIKMEGKKYNGVLNIGFRPTFTAADNKKNPTAEVHIFGLHRPIYGKTIEVVFLKRIRNERKFRNKQRLLLRIEKDIKIAKRYFE